MRGHNGIFGINYLWRGFFAGLISGELSVDTRERVNGECLAITRKIRIGRYLTRLKVLLIDGISCSLESHHEVILKKFNLVLFSTTARRANVVRSDMRSRVSRLICAPASPGS